MSEYQQQDMSPPNYEQPPYPVNVNTNQPQPQAQAQPQPQVVIIAGTNYGENPVNSTCSNCRANIITDIKYESGLATWLLVGGLCFFGCWLGCCLIPFCVNDCKDVEHYCPNCKALLGRHKKL